jgi:hypothetical protein
MEDGADRGSISLGDDEHPQSMVARTTAGKRGVAFGEDRPVAVAKTGTRPNPARAGEHTLWKVTGLVGSSAAVTGLITRRGHYTFCPLTMR